MKIMCLKILKVLNFKGVMMNEFSMRIIWKDVYFGLY